MGAKLAGGGGGGKMQPSSEPNIVPFIDILLVLLIIFMVAAPIATTDVKVDLPPPGDPPPTTEPPKKPTVVDVRDDGTGIPQIFVDGVIVDASELADRVVQAVNTNVPGSPNPLLETVRFRADQTLPYASVMGTMAILQDAKFNKVSMVAEEAISEDKLRR
jgi:biopolymer transport protein ExbD